MAASKLAPDVVQARREFGQWLQQERKRRGLSQGGVRNHLSRVGLVVHVGWLPEREKGKVVLADEHVGPLATVLGLDANVLRRRAAKARVGTVVLADLLPELSGDESRAEFALRMALRRLSTKYGQEDGLATLAASVAEAWESYGSVAFQYVAGPPSSEASPDPSQKMLNALAALAAVSLCGPATQTTFVDAVGHLAEAFYMSDIAANPRAWEGKAPKLGGAVAAALRGVRQPLG